MATGGGKGTIISNGGSQGNLVRIISMGEGWPASGAVGNLVAFSSGSGIPGADYAVSYDSDKGEFNVGAKDSVTYAVHFTSGVGDSYNVYRDGKLESTIDFLGNPYEAVTGGTPAVGTPTYTGFQVSTDGLQTASMIYPNSPTKIQFDFIGYSTVDDHGSGF